ncbi:MAG: gamma carbonic anhydrase family protein [Pseudanabaenaceae cyanobacterium SKYGB_i_bin29]|nr:gamma carbonic anhydrase family protein [Pseudanabaenaceae cyanobacterium SKYG29]MDW8422653.1 gamma carbonic anhydrase family protein [Pseudanabaenaceae cyanobacterium SKYGB_i_bin29]
MHTPDLSLCAFVAPNATVLGDVVVAEGVNIWYQVVIRADLNHITIGAYTNIQDGAILHGDPGKDLVIGDHVTIGHRAVVHGVKIGAGSLIGMGAVILEGVTIGSGSIVGAGAVVTKDVADGVVVAGVPARVVREVTEAEQSELIHHAKSYYQLALQHKT